MATETNEKKCSICGKKFTEWPNDPWPIRKGANDICCDACNIAVVIPARFKNANKKEEE